MQRAGRSSMITDPGPHGVPEPYHMSVGGTAQQSTCSEAIFCSVQMKTS